MKKFKFSIEGNNFEVSVNEIDNNVVEVDVNGSHYNVVLDREIAASRPTVAAPQRKAAGKVAPIAAPTPAASSAPATIIKSQLPGSVIKVVASEGQAVKKGDTVLTLESMKMENAIMAEFDGVVTKIFVQETQSVMQDDKLFEMQGSAAPAAPAAPAPSPAPAAAPAPAPASSGAAKPLKSPLPGSIIKIVVSEGQAVKRGETLLTMESMKMENEIKAEKDCIVRAIKVSEGQSVMQDDVLLDLE